jgi:hypothetical protein
LAGSLAHAAEPQATQVVPIDNYVVADKPVPVVGNASSFAFDLGTKRVNWNNARWAVRTFDKPTKLDGDGLRIRVSADAPRRDAGVYLAVKEADGSWYYHPWAAELSQAENVGVARFRDFTLAEFCAPPGGNHIDENGRLDVDQITAVAVGCISPLGVGAVSFKLQNMEVVRVDDAAPKPVTIAVSGRPIDINGTTEIPAGVFGYYLGPKGCEETYALGSSRKIVSNRGDAGDPFFAAGTIEMAINCVGERIWPSLRLTDADWKQKTEALARKFAKAADDKLGDKPFYVEFYNEPYLNWANKNRANFIPRFYDETKAVEGGPVHIKHDGAVVPHLKWTKQFAAPPWQWLAEKDWRRGKTVAGNVFSTHAQPYHKGVVPLYGGDWQPATHPPADVPDGQTYDAKLKDKSVTLTAFTPWHIYDETQFTYWSGAGMQLFYIDQAKAFGAALKQARPKNTNYLVGWGLRYSEDHWACWENLVKPTVDATIDLIDGVHDHDYGGEPTKMTGNYEVLVAYAQTKFNKRLWGYNTEQGANVDAQAYPDAAADAKTAHANAAKYRFAARKLMHLLAHSPDKVKALTHFDFAADGEGVALAQLKPLRGRLMQIDCDADDVDAVASLNNGSLVVALFNDGPSARQATLKLPGGPETVDLPPQRIVVIEKPLQLDANAASVTRRQFFAKPILQEVTPDQPATDAAVAIDPALLGRAKRAWIRVVAERLAEGEGAVEVNGKPYPLPRACTPENVPYVRDVLIDVADLKASTSLTFKTKPGSAGWLLGAGSVYVEAE